MLFYGLAGFILIIAASFIRRTKDKYEDFCVGAAIPIFLFMLLPLALATSWLRPLTIDGSLRAIDLALGLDGFALRRWLISRHYDFFLVLYFVYPTLPLLMALAWVLERPRTLLRAAVIGAVLAFPLYLLFPAVGPEYAFSNFPSASAHLVPVAWFHPRNCVPSMHFTWALLLVVNISSWRWRWIFIVYALLMAFATVVGGEHYFIDVLAAIPFTIAVQKVAELHALRSQRLSSVPQSVRVTS
ncbi:MAG TPA: phosphatase PAP2 family protein [Terriglobales bacterium]|nr:phosphatase PAP2 family protein [Terriglobales bacterium]